MKKLLGLLAVTPLAVTACGGAAATTTDAKLERSEEAASTEVKAAFKTLLTEATGKKYDINDGSKLNFLTGKDVNTANLAVGNWYKTDGTGLFTDADIDALTLGQAYRAAMYFGIDTFNPYTALANQEGELLNGFMTKTVTGATEPSPAAYFPAQAKTLVDAIKEDQGDTLDYKLTSYQNTGWREDIYTSMAGNLALIGIKANPVSTDWATHLTDTQAGKHQVFIGGWGTVTGHPAYGLFGPYHTQSGPQGGNRMLMSSSAVDTAIDAAAWMDTTNADIEYAKAQTAIAKEFASVPLYAGSARYFYQNATGGVPAGAIQRDGSHFYHDFEKSGTWNVATTGNFDSLHPHGSNDSGSTLINKQLYQSLWKQNADAHSGQATTFDSMLIDEAMVDLNPTAGALTVTLKSNAKWSDGKDVTVDEVVDSINRAIVAPEIAGVTPGVIGAQAGTIDATGTVENTDAYKFTIFFGEGNTGVEKGDWISDTNTIDFGKVDVKDFSAWKQTIAHAGFAINKVDVADFTNDVTKIIGTGKYKITEIDSADNVTMVKVTGHHSMVDAKNDGVYVRVVDDTAAATLAFNSNQVDFVDAVTATDWAAGDSSKKDSYGTYRTDFIGFNLNQI